MVGSAKRQCSFKSADSFFVIPSTFRSASTVEAVQIDIEDDASVQKLFETVSSKYSKLDVLINNAGSQFDQQLASGKLSLREVWDKSWTVNVISTLAETDNLALPLNRSLDAEAKGTWPKAAKFAGLPAYRSSKTGLNMLMREWHRLVKNDGVRVWAISPGTLATDLGGVGSEALKAVGAEDPTLGAKFVRDVAKGARDDDAGKVIRRANVQPW